MQTNGLYGRQELSSWAQPKSAQGDLSHNIAEAEPKTAEQPAPGDREWIVMLRMVEPIVPAGGTPDFGLVTERRAVLRALADWEAIRRQSTVPPVSALVALGGFTRAGNRLLLKQDPNPMRSVFILGNDDLQSTFSRRLEGAIVDDILPDSLRTRIGLACATSVARNEARTIAGSYAGPGGLEVRYRGIFMPVAASDGRHTGYIFGAFCSRGYATRAIEVG